MVMPDKQHIEATADVLHRGEPVALRVDPRPVYVILIPTTSQGKPYEVDFVAVDSDMKTPMIMTRKQRRRLAKFMSRVIPLMCRTWYERHPEN
jgi:hypothetical protein